jgi:hypothetical protein
MTDQSVLACITDGVENFQTLDLLDITRMMSQGFKIEFEGEDIKLYHHNSDFLAQVYEELTGEEWHGKLTFQA